MKIVLELDEKQTQYVVEVARRFKIDPEAVIGGVIDFAATRRAARDPKPATPEEGQQPHPLRSERPNTISRHLIDVYWERMNTRSWYRFLIEGLYERIPEELWRVESKKKRLRSLRRILDLLKTRGLLNFEPAGNGAFRWLSLANRKQTSRPRLP